MKNPLHWPDLPRLVVPRIAEVEGRAQNHRAMVSRAEKPHHENLQQTFPITLLSSPSSSHLKPFPPFLSFASDMCRDMKSKQQTAGARKDPQTSSSSRSLFIESNISFRDVNILSVVTSSTTKTIEPQAKTTQKIENQNWMFVHHGAVVVVLHGMLSSHCLIHSVPFFLVRTVYAVKHIQRVS